MPIPVKLQVFEGPLDLLMHLIEKHKIDIYDIPIVLITDQYMAYIEAMEHEDMDVSSEFMLMAATLLDIKCRMLLPPEEDEEEEAEDPRAELVAQLLEYKKYKYMSGELRSLMEQSGDLITRSQDIPDEVRAYRIPVDPEELLTDLTLQKLQKVFQEVMQRREDRTDQTRSHFGKIEKEKVSLSEKLTYVHEKAIRKRRCSFRQLLEGQSSRLQVVVTFLAVLELMKDGRISISQEESFGEIEIVSLEAEDAEVKLYREDSLEETFA